ncbi:MAG: carboxypeptidase regulatory-like domain-containing protein [Acidobacteriaceae bacterium]
MENRQSLAFQRIRLILVMFFFIMLIRTDAYAQSSNGQISGVVTDSSGAAIVKAEVVATNSATGVSYRTTSNNSGVYLLPQLLPGQYSLAITSQGFSPVTQNDVTLRTGDHLALDFKLTPGAEKQTVTVTANLPLISTDQSSNSTVLSNKMITELPQLNRNSLDLTAVIPSVQGEGPLSNNIQSLGNAAYLIANHGNSYSIGGGQVNGTNIMVDGNPVQEPNFNSSNRSIPTPDSIGEFRVESGVLTADHGRYSGGVITLQTQSGGNELHGRLFEYFRNQALNSNDWMNNAQGIPLQPFHQNNYGLSIGGPISIPHVYSGKNKTFFYFGWEGERFSQGQTIKSTVPTVLNRAGDFSQTVINYQNGQPVYANIYDPFHGYVDGGGNWVRPQFPGNVIPLQSNTLSTQSQLFLHYMDLWPLPNHAPDANSDHTNNYWSSIKTSRPTDRFFVRIDENLNNNHHFNFSLSRSRMNNVIPAPFFHAARSVTADHDWSGSLLYNWVLSPTSILDVHLGFGTTKLYSDGVSGYGSDPDPSIDMTTWGFDPLIVNNPERSVSDIPPAINPFGYTPVGGAEFDSFITQAANGSVSFTKVLSRHTIKVGYEQYFSRFQEQGGDKTGVAWVNPGGGSNQFWNNNDGLTGSPLAELMMGSSNFFQWGNWNITPYGWDQAAFITDDWKVNNKLTVQIGLRWDHDGGRQARHPQGSLVYDINAKNVLTPNAGWDWSQVVAAVPALENLPQPAWLSQGATGRVALLDTPEYPQKNLYTTNWMNFQPRLGISYALTEKTVLHAAAGIIYQGLNGLSTDYFSFYYNSPTFNQISSLDGMHWISEFGSDHGLRTFPSLPSGANLGYYPPVTTNADYWFQTYGAAANIDQAGTTLGHFDSPQDYIWQFSVQHELNNSWVASVQYMGDRGIHLLMPVWNWSLNNTPTGYYSLGADLQTQVPNPFYGQSQSFETQPTVSLYQLLALSPQYAQSGPGQATWGKSFANYLNFEVQGRGFHGLNLLASYAIRKTLTNTGGKDIQHAGPAGIGILQDPHNLMEGYGVALYEMPQTLKLNYSYDLPFGRGRMFLNDTNGIGNKILNGLVGGWGLAGITTWNPKGTPVLVPTVDGGVTAPGAAIRWSLADSNYLKSNKDYSRGLFVNGAFLSSNPQGVFNSSSFLRTPDYTIGDSPFVFPNVRNPGSFYTDATLLKKFQLGARESRYLEARVEALNVFNHPNFGAIDNNPDSPTFGGVNGKSGSRTMQIGLRLFF